MKLFVSFKSLKNTCAMWCVDVYEESEADLRSERNNNNWYRSTQSRSPDVTFDYGTKTDIRKLSSGYFVCVWKNPFLFFLLLFFVKCTQKIYTRKCIYVGIKIFILVFVWILKFTFIHHFYFSVYFCTFITNLPPISIWYCTFAISFLFCNFATTFFYIYKYSCFVLFYFFIVHTKWVNAACFQIILFSFCLFGFCYHYIYLFVRCYGTLHIHTLGFDHSNNQTKRKKYTNTYNTCTIDGSTNSDWYVEATGRRRSSGKWCIKIFKWNLGKICKLLLSSLLA